MNKLTPKPFFDESACGPDETEHVSLCEALDRILNKGAVLFGEVTISVANVDLLYLGLQVILASLDTARDFISPENCPSEKQLDGGKVKLFS